MLTKQQKDNCKVFHCFELTGEIDNVTAMNHTQNDLPGHLSESDSKNRSKPRLQR